MTEIEKGRNEGKESRRGRKEKSSGARQRPREKGEERLLEKAGDTGRDTRLSIHVFFLGSAALGWELELVFSLIGIKRR